MDDVIRVVAEVRARAERDEAAAFDLQYELARRAERTMARFEADGEAKAREWAERDRRDEADRRFDPEADDAEPTPVGRRGAPAGPHRAGTDDEADDETDDETDEYGEDGPTTWLR